MTIGLGDALESFILEHEYCGELDTAVEDDRVWMTCTCGATVNCNCEKEVAMSDTVIQPGAGFVNLSPDAFRMWARHYYKCRQDFKSPHDFSPVPYFLLCRAIELTIKALHLENKNRKEVKDEFGHNLIKAYEALTAEQRILDGTELKVLRLANDIYRGKGFEYFNPGDALRGYSNFPDLAGLDATASKFVEP